MSHCFIFQLDDDKLGQRDTTLRTLLDKRKFNTYKINLIMKILSVPDRKAAMRFCNMAMFSSISRRVLSLV